METTNITPKAKSNSEAIVSKIKKAVKFFIAGYTEYSMCSFSDTPFYSTWYGHPCGIR